MFDQKFIDKKGIGHGILLQMLPGSPEITFATPGVAQVPDNFRERVISEVGPLRWFQVSSSSSSNILDWLKEFHFRRGHGKYSTIYDIILY